MGTKREKEINQVFSLTEGSERLGGRGTLVKGKVQRTDDPIDVDPQPIASANILDSPLVAKSKGRKPFTPGKVSSTTRASLFKRGQALKKERELEKLNRDSDFGFTSDPKRVKVGEDATKNVLPPYARSEIIALAEKMARPKLERDVGRQVSKLNEVYNPPFAENVVSVLREFQDKPDLFNLAFRHPNYAAAIVADLALLKGKQSNGYHYTHRFLRTNEDRPKEYQELVNGLSSALKEQGTTFTFLDDQGNILSTGSLDFNSPDQPEPPLKNILADPDAAIKTVSLREVGETEANPADVSTSGIDPPETSLEDDVGNFDASKEQAKSFQQTNPEPTLGQRDETDVQSNVDDTLGTDNLENVDDSENVDADGDTVVSDVPSENTPSEEAINAKQKSEENAEEIKKEKEKNENQDKKMTDFQDELFDAQQKLNANEITIDQFKDKFRDLEDKFRDEKHAQQIAELQRQIKESSDNTRIQLELKRESNKLLLENRRLDLEARKLDAREKTEEKREEKRETERREERALEREERREEREERRKREDLIDKREARRDDRELRKDEQAQLIQLAKIQPKEKASTTFGLSPQQLKIIKQKTMAEIMQEFKEKKKAKKKAKKGPKDKRKKIQKKKSK